MKHLFIPQLLVASAAFLAASAFGIGQEKSVDTAAKPVPAAELKIAILDAKSEAPALNALNQILGKENPADSNSAESNSPSVDYSESDLYCISIACKQLAIYGSDASVPRLESMLPDSRLNQYARLALESIPSGSAEAALIRGAETLAGQQRANCIDSLGSIRSAAVVAPIIQIVAKDKDPLVQKAGWEALGQIATDESLAALLAAQPDELSKPGLATGLLNAADACLRTGNLDQARAAYRKLADGAFSKPVHRAARYRGWLIQEPGQQRDESIVRALGSANPNDYEPALKTIRELAPESGPTIADLVLAQFGKWNFARQALVVSALLDRSDAQTGQVFLPIVQKWAQSGRQDEVLTALKILKSANRLDANQTWPLLETILKNNPDEPVQSAVIGIALETPGPEIENQIVDFISRCAPEDLQTVRLILNSRYIPQAARPLLKRASDESLTYEQRNAALSGLAAIVDLESFPEFLSALDRLANDAQKQAFLQKSCVHLPQKESAETIVRLIQSSSCQEKNALLPILKIIGGSDALEELGKRCRDPETLNTSTQILGSWNDPETIADCAALCLAVSQSPVDEKYQIRALRGYIRVVRQFNLPSNVKIEMCARFFAAAKRESDKLLVFDVLRRIISPESAEAAWTFANAEFSREPGCECVLTIAREVKEKDARIAAVLEQVVRTSKNKDTVSAAQDLFEKLR